MYKRHDFFSFGMLLKMDIISRLYLVLGNAISYRFHAAVKHGVVKV